MKLFIRDVLADELTSSLSDWPCPFGVRPFFRFSAISPRIIPFFDRFYWPGESTFLLLTQGLKQHIFPKRLSRPVRRGKELKAGILWVPVFYFDTGIFTKTLALDFRSEFSARLFGLTFWWHLFFQGAFSILRHPAPSRAILCAPRSFRIGNNPPQVLV